MNERQGFLTNIHELRARRASTPGSFQRKVDVPVVLGFSAAMAWLAHLFVVIGSSEPTLSPSYQVNTYHAIILSVTSVSLLLFFLSPKTVRQKLQSGAYDVRLSASLFLFTPVFTVASYFPEDLTALVHICLIICSVAIGFLAACLYLRWGIALGRLDSISSFIALSLSFVLIEVYSNLFAIVNSWFLVVPTALLICVSGYCLYLCKASPSRAQRASDKATSDKNWSLKYPAKFGISLLIMATINKLVMHYCLGIPVIHAEVVSSPLPQVALTFLVIAAVFSSGLVLSVYREYFGFRSVYGVFFIMSILALLLLPFMFKNGFVIVAYVLNDAADQVFCLLFWFLFAAMCRSSTESGIVVFSFCLGMRFLGTLLGMIAGVEISAFYSDSVTYAIVVVGILAISICYTFVFTERDALSAERVIPLKRSSPFKEKCRIVWEQYGLSDREQDVAFLIATGENNVEIQKKLFISQGTVSTHRMHIYQKLGIHSKRELASLIENFEVESLLES